MLDHFFRRVCILLRYLVLHEIGQRAGRIHAEHGTESAAGTVLQRLNLVVGQKSVTEDILALELHIGLFNSLHALRCRQVDKAPVRKVEKVDRQEAASVGDHHRRLNMLVHGIAILAANVDIVHLAAGENGVQYVHIGGELVRLVESLEVFNCESCGLHSANSERDAIFTRLPDVQFFTGIDAQRSVVVPCLQMPLSKCAQVFFDFLTAHVVVGISVAGFDHLREVLTISLVFKDFRC